MAKRLVKRRRFQVRLPNTRHEECVAALTGEPTFMDVSDDVIDELQARLVECGAFAPNVMCMGYVIDLLWEVYIAGERRGDARNRNPATALFPLPEPLGRETPPVPSGFDAVALGA